jgi:hypothetical protein
MTGVTILDKIIEMIRPPISTNANGAMSGLGFKAIFKVEKGRQEKN